MSTIECRTSWAVNAPQVSWNLMPWRKVIVQLLPSGVISHFSASCGMYAPVLGLIPTRYSRAGRLSSMPLRLCAQERFVSHPSGATATMSRFSLAAYAGAALYDQAAITISPRYHIPFSHVSFGPHVCITISSVAGYGTCLTYSRSVKKPVITPENVYSAWNTTVYLS